MADRRGAVQYGALPYTLDDGGMRIMLVTSRATRRWIIPKGWPMKLLPPHKAAAREAFEEAGVVGKPLKGTVGAYQYEKLTDDGLLLHCTVTVYPLRVRRLDDEWPEAHQRERRWFMQDEAARLVDEPELRAILRDYRPTD